MRRLNLVILGFLSFALVSGRNPASVEGLGRASGAQVARDEASRISAIVRRMNPALSEPESTRIGRAVLNSSARFDLDPELVTAVLLVESGGRPWARSPKGAVGLMQVMPHMASGMQIAGNLTIIESNIEAGCSILAGNIRRLGESDGISAYFWGSEIRGVDYLDRVREARAVVRRFSES